MYTVRNYKPSDRERLRYIAMETAWEQGCLMNYQIICINKGMNIWLCAVSADTQAVINFIGNTAF